ncbi:type IV secretory system conjugative DNA transfer family protein, partial [Arthrobacter sp.]|uniref:type IV secretory system conjugative DNA transfer family protein n=1 Tax=Arthrobacter sp. TaxID=1667 RepID=UPI002590CB8F
NRWNRYATSPAVERLGLPAGSQLRAVEYGENGVSVHIRVPAGTVLAPAARAARDTAVAWEWGSYKRIQPSTTTDFELRREIVGDDPATPWRAAGKAAGAVFLGERTRQGNRVEHVIWARAGLTVARTDKTLVYPQVLSKEVGERGPELLLKLPGGLPIDSALKARGALASLFRCPELSVEAEGTHLRIRLNVKPAATLPQTVPLYPTTLWRPTSAAQAIGIGKKLTLPVGVTLQGGKLQHIEIEPALVPHGILVGAPGSGKSRWARSAFSAWAVQGGLLAIGDPKGGELVESYLPGCVHISTSRASIYRLVLWAQTEMKMRLAVQSKLKAKHGISDLPVRPVLVVLDELGQLFTELEQSTDPAAKFARAELERAITNAMQVGRSVGIHLLLITQNALASSLPGGIAQAASFRVNAGRPTEGASGSGTVGRLFPAAMRDRAAELGATIPTGSRGMLLLDHEGAPVVARSYYGYTPGEEPEDLKFANLDPEITASWTAMRDQLKLVQPGIRFGWRAPDDLPEWQSLSLSAGPKGEWRTVAELTPIALDRMELGRPVPIPEHAIYDPLSEQYEGGFDAIDLAHHHSPDLDS